MNFGNIHSLETYTDEFVCFVKVKTDQGLEGWGQTSTYNADITAQVLHRQIAPWVLGQSADDIGYLINRVEAKEHKFPGSYRCRANAGLDTALWDLQGKALGKPVVELNNFQLNLLLYTRIFKSIFENNEDIPEKIKKDPKALLDFANSSEAREEIKSKMNESSSASTIVGATSEDLEELGVTKSNKNSLHEAAKKKGGSLSMKDLMDLSGA